MELLMTFGKVSFFSYKFTNESNYDTYEMEALRN